MLSMVVHVTSPEMETLYLSLLIYLKIVAILHLVTSFISTRRLIFRIKFFLQAQAHHDEHYYYGMFVTGFYGFVI